MNYHYKKEFASVLRDGTKKHTIRAKAIATGRTLKHIIYPYQRDKRECVLENVCLCTQNIEIKPGAECINDGKIWIEGRLLNIEQMQRLAWNDGFPSLIAFWLYFQEHFRGHIIHWTELKY